MSMRRKGIVVLADDDADARAMAARSLERGGYDVIEVESGVEALELAGQPTVRLAVLEVTLPDMNGYEVCQELRRARGNELAIFFLSGTRTEPLDRATGLLFGADDFIVKPFDPSEFIARVNRFVSRNETPWREADTGGTPAAQNLTGREQQILELLARGQGQKAIAGELSISAKTVSTHIQHLHAKLGVHSRAELVAFAYYSGLVSPPVRQARVPVAAA